MWAGFICRQDVSISIFGRTKEFSEVRGTSLMCNFGVRSRFLDVIYGVRPPNGSPVINIFKRWLVQEMCETLLIYFKISLGTLCHSLLTDLICMSIKSLPVYVSLIAFFFLNKCVLNVIKSSLSMKPLYRIRVYQNEPL